MNYHPAFKLALGALWTAGHTPGFAERNALLSAVGSSKSMSPDDIRRQAAAALTKLGYAIAPNPTGIRLLPKARDVVPLDGPPSPGHAVRLTGEFLVPKGGLMHLQGCIGDPRRGHCLAAPGSWTCVFSGGNRHVSLSAGGPATIQAVDTARFQQTDDVTTLRVWDFAFSPEADGAVPFEIDVPVFEWDGDRRDTISYPKADQPSRWSQPAVLRATA